jgi:hypothetical protein
MPLQNTKTCHVNSQVLITWAFTVMSYLQTQNGVQYGALSTDVSESSECGNEKQHTAISCTLKKVFNHNLHTSIPFNTFHLLPFCEILYFHSSYYEEACILKCATSITYLMIEAAHFYQTAWCHISVDSAYTTSSHNHDTELSGFVNNKKFIHFRYLGMKQYVTSTVRVTHRAHSYIWWYVSKHTYTHMHTRTHTIVVDCIRKSLLIAEEVMKKYTCLKYILYIYFHIYIYYYFYVLCCIYKYV